MAQTRIRNPVEITHPKQPGKSAFIPRRALKHWQALGWEPVKDEAKSAGAGAGKGK